MKYINLFDTQAAYDAAEKYYPNVSYIEATDEVVYAETAPHDYSQDYLTFEALESGTFSCNVAIDYSLDGGATWTTLAANTASPTVNQGEKILWKGQINWNAKSFSSTGRFNAEGNIMSLMYGDNFANQTALPNSSWKFAWGVFYQNSRLVSAENLVLPATTLTDSCYNYMFYGCTALTTPPKTLPATTLTSSCYTNMFKNCTSLTTAPELPATTLANACYGYMFNGCTSLTTAPELPATTLANHCYNGMFSGCTSLITAPELPATTLLNRCYMQMFQNCSAINQIKMLATSGLSEEYCLYKWVEGVAATGTFTKDASMTTLPTGDSGIPSGWTVQNA